MIAGSEKRSVGTLACGHVLNPKAAVFYISVLPAFTDPARAFAGQATPLVLIYVAVATAVHLVIILAADRAVGLLAQGQRRQQAGRVMALVARRA